MESDPAHPLLRLVRVVGGGLLLVAGVAGLILPVLPGWLLIVAGLSLWSSEFHWAGRLRQRAREELRRRTREWKAR